MHQPRTPHLPKPGKAPCGTCPYRTDVPAGIWDAREYEKLRAYDGETHEQVFKGTLALFYCHQQDGHLCAGWVACHDTEHLLALRVNDVHPDTFDYKSPVPVFNSGAAAAAHGMSGIDHLDEAAIFAIRKLLLKRNGPDQDHPDEITNPD